MLNLLRIDLGKLLRGKIFWLTVLIYCVIIFATFIPLSFMEDFTSMMPTELLSAVDMEQLNVDMEQVDEMLTSLRSGDNFILSFYRASSGQFAVVMILVILFIYAEFRNRTLQNTLLCGYSRKQVYFSKLITGYVGGCVYFIICIATVCLLGFGFYRMPLGGEILCTAFQLLLSQCVILVEFVAVYTATAFIFGNGWAFLGSTLVFTLLPGIPLISALLQGKNQFFSAAYMPSFISANGVGGFITTDMMLAMPKLWTPALVISALTVLVVLTAGSTVLGVRAFQKKRL